MLKYSLVLFTLLSASWMPAKAFCQQDITGQQTISIDGTITYVDVAGEIINVQTANGPMLFYITVQSDLYRLAHHMASIGIEKGDPVTIQYKMDDQGKNNIIKLVDRKPDNF